MTGCQICPPLDVITQACEAAIAVLPIDAAAVTVGTASGHHGIVHATDPRCTDLEDRAYTLGDGPSLTAFTTSLEVSIEDLATAEQWPMYSSIAVHEGFGALFVFPLTVGAHPVGTMTLYAVRPTTLTPADRDRARELFAGTAEALVSHVVTTIDGDGDGDGDGAGAKSDLADGGFLQAEVYQACGMVSVQLHVPVDVALGALRAYAMSHDLLLPGVAHDVVTRAVRF